MEKETMMSLKGAALWFTVGTAVAIAIKLAFGFGQDPREVFTYLCGAYGFAFAFWVMGGTR